MRFIRHILTILFLALLLAGCSSLEAPHPNITAYVLEYEQPAGPVAHPLAVTLTVERFSVNPLYDSLKIIYREAPRTRDSYHYHQWRVNPAKQVDTLLLRDLIQSGLFTGVFSREARQRTDYVLEGTVDEFLEWDTSDDCQAVLAVTLTLLDNRVTNGQKVLFQKQFSSRKSCVPKSPRTVAAAMSQAMAEISTQTLEEIEKTIRLGN